MTVARSWPSTCARRLRPSGRTCAGTTTGGRRGTIWWPGRPGTPASRPEAAPDRLSIHPSIRLRCCAQQLEEGLENQHEYFGAMLDSTSTTYSPISLCLCRDGKERKGKEEKKGKKKRKERGRWSIHPEKYPLYRQAVRVFPFK